MDSSVETIQKLMKWISINTYEIGSAHWVDVTHINNPHSFYVRPTFCRRYLPKINDFIENTLPDEMIVGSIVIYKSKVLQCYVRGRIMFVKTENDVTTCDFYALDFGCFEKQIPWNKTRQPCIDTIDVPPLALHCQLADCKPFDETWSMRAIESMKFFVGKERARMLIRGKTPDALIVELVNSCPEDIATMLALSGDTTLGYSDNMISRFSQTEPEKHYYTYKEYDCGSTLTVRVQAGDSLEGFYVAEVKDYTVYFNDRENFTYFCKIQKDLEPDDVKEDMAVAVLTMANGKYERGHIKEVNKQEEKVTVLLVDWGKTVTVPFMRLKPMTNETFFLRPVLAMYCKAEKSQAWDNGLSKFLFPGYQFKITIVESGNGEGLPYVVNLEPLKKT
ncbi:uncharacterized protein LOC135078798 [Ostrinia nubilalis]|uniref:uncharacterized protein LOC135078798 n=1 Tax=Ostrinia nubilalis TaxID=29057 RepID=UPI00308266F4